MTLAIIPTTRVDTKRVRVCRVNEVESKLPNKENSKTGSNHCCDNMRARHTTQELCLYSDRMKVILERQPFEILI